MKPLLFPALVLVLLDACAPLLRAVGGEGDVGAPRYTIARDGKPVLAESSLGLVRDDADFSTGLALEKTSRATSVRDRYELQVSKRLKNDYRANRRVFSLATRDGKKIEIVFQVSDDGVAFRYVFPGKSAELRTVPADHSTFRLPERSVAWLQAMQVAKSGWEKTNPAYEEFYQKEIPVGTPSPLGHGWVYPALFRAGDTWLAVTESSVGPRDAASHLAHASPNGEYAIAYPDPRETMRGESVLPSSALPWSTPWRIVAVGDLKTLVESTLGTDLAAPSAVKPPRGSVRPGRASWSWPLLGDPSVKFDTQIRFIDYAADMGWEYCLVDGLWDTQIGYDKISELAAYAQSKNVGLLLWYNSNGDWNTAYQTPKQKLLDRETRLAEFARLRDMGIKGMKIDFFAGDGRPVIEYYHDLLRDAAAFGLLVNFHGTTLPRGLQRTYPNLMTAEAIRGLEYITFEQKDADQQPSHCAMLPFTRNLFDPMDFTPVVLDKLPGKKKRRTTVGFELALSVLFTSGIQHYAETPAGMAAAPALARDFLRTVPSVWEDVRFIDGVPGKHVVIARRAAGRWFVAGINGEQTDKLLSLDLSSLKPAGPARLVADADGSLREQTLEPAALGKLDLTLRPAGGFVLTVPASK